MVYTARFLKGFPDVAAVNGTTQPGRAAGQDHTYAAKRRVLPGGATAHAVLKIEDPGAIGCPTAEATGLKVVPPNDTMAAFVPLSFTTCTGNNRNLITRVIRHGTGIPGHSQ